MNLTIISVGNKPNKWELEGINHYLKQLKNNIRVDFINIKGQQNPKRSTAEVLKLEAGLISQKIPSDSYLILCDMAGERLSSTGLSKLFEAFGAMRSPRELFCGPMLVHFCARGAHLGFKMASGWL